MREVLLCSAKGEGKGVAVFNAQVASCRVNYTRTLLLLSFAVRSTRE